MNTRSVRNGFASVCIGALAFGVGARAQDSTTRDRDVVPLAKSATTATPAKGSTGSRSPSGKGPLPDPTLLDGSTLPAEKKPEQGMLGDFELPGDENARNNRVGGQQQPQAGAQGGAQMQGLPQMSGGGAAGQQSQGQMPQMPAGAQASAGGGPQPSGQQPPQQGAGGPGGPNDPNAKAEGMQVGNLQTDPNAAGGDAGAAGDAGAQKPQQVAIGDTAMQIKGVSNAPNVVGAQMPAGSTQQMESKVGGGKGSSAVSGGRNASERGRAMPSGL